jgi:hypothetical protein
MSENKPGAMKVIATDGKGVFIALLPFFGFMLLTSDLLWFVDH